MKIKSVGSGSALVELTHEDISTLNSALNEVCNGIHLGRGFETRMGCTVEEARDLLAEIHRLAESFDSN
jgi:hypothetical protein